MASYQSTSTTHVVGAHDRPDAAVIARCLCALLLSIGLPGIGCTGGPLSTAGDGQDAAGLRADAGLSTMIVSTDGAGSALVTLDGTGSVDRDSEITSYNWYLGLDLLATGPIAHVELPTGAHEITLVVLDEAGQTASETFTITVIEESAGATPRFFLPWAEGSSRRIGQGNNGSFSHVGLFAWDIPMPVGTPILATAAGRVIDTLDTTAREDASILEVTDSANFVTIDHGSGLQSLYAHMDFQGVTVVPGQWVVRGQVIGFSGNTGFSTAPHLHYEVLDTVGASVPTGFFEVDTEDGVPVEGDMVTSQNALNVDTIDTYAPSPLPPDAFYVNDIELVGNPPPVHFYFNETDYSISGRVLDGKTRVCVALVDSETFETVFCDLTDVDEDGSFTIPFRFPAELVGRHYFGIISGDGGAEGVTPLSVLISPPADLQTRPVAVIDTPDNQFIDFWQTHSLSGIESFSPVDRALDYQWMQVSGPLAEIDDPTAPETQFRLELGAGIKRVSFQLVVFDGELHSFPAQVDFNMPDTFFVSRIGVADELCLTADDCLVFEVPPPVVSFSTQVIQGWVELVNPEIGDTLTFTITDPTGEVARTLDADVADEPPAVSFWRFNWTSNGLDLLPGPWTATFERNGQLQSSIEFRVMP